MSVSHKLLTVDVLNHLIVKMTELLAAKSMDRALLNQKLQVFLRNSAFSGVFDGKLGSSGAEWTLLRMTCGANGNMPESRKPLTRSLSKSWFDQTSQK